MIFPAKMTTFRDILERVHSKFATAVKSGGELEGVQEKAAIVAGGLLARNVPLTSLVGKYDEVIEQLSSFLKSPSGFGKDGKLPDLPLFRTVSLFQNEVKTLGAAAEFGVIGVFAALIGEDVAFVSPESDNPPTRYEDWDFPNRIRMAWAIPTLRARVMHLNDSSRGNELADFDDDGYTLLPDPDLATDVAYIAQMVYRRAVRRLLRSLLMCESAGYAITLLTGTGNPASYYTTEEEDFLPMDVVERMNQTMHYDPPTGYILAKGKVVLGRDRNLYSSYHAHAGILPSLRDLCRCDALKYSKLTGSVRDQLAAWYQDSGKLKDASYALVITPQLRGPVRDASRIAIDFAIQHLLAKTGALTPGTDARHRWFRYYVNLGYSYGALLTDHLAIRGLVIENGAFTAYLTRFVINKEEESGPVQSSFLVFADRGFMSDMTKELGDPQIEIDGKIYSLAFKYTSEWIPAGPGLRPGDRDIGDDPSTGLPALDDALGTDSRFSPYAAYSVTVTQEVKS